MAERSLGKITTTAGSSLRFTNNESSPTANLGAHSYLVQALSTNTGKVYIGTSSPVDRTNLTNVIAVLPPPTANIFPSFSATITYAPAGFNLAERYIDVETSGEGVLISYIEA